MHFNKVVFMLPRKLLHVRQLAQRLNSSPTETDYHGYRSFSCTFGVFLSSCGTRFEDLLLYLSYWLGIAFPCLRYLTTRFTHHATITSKKKQSQFKILEILHFH